MSKSLADKHPIVNWFIQNSVSSNLLMFGILLGGLYMVGFFGLGGMTSKLPLEAFPLVETNTITVTASLNGSTPEDVEQGVTNKIEDALQGVTGVDEMTSYSKANVSRVAVTAITDYDIEKLLGDIKTAVDSINGLPAEVEKVLVSKNTRRRPILWVTMSGEASEKALLIQAQNLKKKLLSNTFVEAVDIDGEKDAEIAIEISGRTLEEYGLTLAQVASAIDNGSVDLSAGELSTSQGSIALRVKSQAYEQNAYADIIIRTQADGSTLRVGDIAAVKDGFEEQKTISEFNGEPSVTLRLSSGENANVIEADNAATSIVDDFSSSLPSNIKTTIWNNRVNSVRDRINMFARNAASGIVLVFLLLTIFLNLKLAFWVALGIPVSFAGALLAMGFSGISINLITLFGFIIVLGIVVDDAIVIGESIYTWKKRLKNAPDATLYGTSRVATAATFGVLTTVAAFLPLTQVSGSTGDILGQIGWVVIFCLIFSLIESKLILPSHLNHTRVALREETSRNPWVIFQSSVSHGLEMLVEKTYLPALGFALRQRYFTLIIFISVFIIAIGSVIGGIIKVSRMPQIEAQNISLTVTMDNTVNADTTITWAKKANDALREADKQLMAENGENQPNITNISVTNTTDTNFKVRAGLAGADTRTLSGQAIANKWREILGRIPGSNTVSYTSTQRFSRAAVEVQVLSDNIESQLKVAQEVMDALATIDGTKDIFNSEENVAQEIRITMKPEARIYGITRSQLARNMRAAFYGVQAERVQRGTNEVRVMVRYPKAERESLADLENFLVKTTNGQSIPISAVATLSYETSSPRIMHLNKQRIVSVYADVDRTVITPEEVVTNLFYSGILEQLATQYDVTINLGGDAKEGAKSDASMIVGFIISMVMIYVLLAIPLKSYTSPIIIMAVIPFGIIGAIAGHWILGYNISMVGIFGIIALSGVVVNDSLLLISTIQQHRDEEVPIFEAIERTGVRRFRPIILTSITTFAGLMPILFETSFQAQFLIPMAISLGFGILFATAITLILVPILYCIVHDIKLLFFIEIKEQGETTTEL